MTAYLPNILITGADGQMGMALQKHSQAAAFQLHPCSRAMLDITNADAIESAFSTFKNRL